MSANKATGIDGITSHSLKAGTRIICDFSSIYYEFVYLGTTNSHYTWVFLRFKNIKYTY